MLASRPTTRPVASIITHFFSMSAGLAENVFMTRLPADPGAVGNAGSYTCGRPAVNAPAKIISSPSQCLTIMVLYYLGLSSDAIRRVRIGRGGVIGWHYLGCVATGGLVSRTHLS